MVKWKVTLAALAMPIFIASTQAAVNAAASAAQQLGLTVIWQAHQVEGTWH
jgi:hypothetical protein